MGEIKLKLSKETLDEIRECDRDYAAKGYSIDWSAVHITILKKLIKQNTQGLAKVFETEPPEALAIFHKEQSDTEVKQRRRLTWSLSIKKNLKWKKRLKLYEL